MVSAEILKCREWSIKVNLLTYRWWTTATGLLPLSQSINITTTTNTQWCSKCLLSRCADYVIARWLVTDLSGASMAAQVWRLLWRPLRSMSDTVTIICCTTAWMVVTVTIIIAANCWMSFQAGYTDRHIVQQVSFQIMCNYNEKKDTWKKDTTHRFVEWLDGINSLVLNR